jgi:hypothetical protein
MRVRLVRKPGQSGTKAYVEEYGERLVCVRYRYDIQRKRRYKTIEIIVEERPWSPALRPGMLVGVKINYGERDLARKVREAGGVWHPQEKLWALLYEEAMRLGLSQRITSLL